MTTSVDVPPDDVTGIVRRRMRADRIPGLSLAVVADRALRWAAGFGLADLVTGAPVRPETAFLWFSMTKIVTRDRGHAACGARAPGSGRPRQHLPARVRERWCSRGR